MICFTPPGTGHGGHGGQSPSEPSTGMPYSDLFEPFEWGCRGGETVGRGGGIIYMTIPDRMKIDGEVSSNGEASNPCLRVAVTAQSIYTPTSFRYAPFQSNPFRCVDDLVLIFYLFV